MVLKNGVGSAKGVRPALLSQSCWKSASFSKWTAGLEHLMPNIIIRASAGPVSPSHLLWVTLLL
jgi:hypothetical protein